MANYKTGAQRYNDRMDKIFDRAKSENRGLVGNSHTDGYGANSPAMKAERKKFMAKKMKFTTAAMRDKSKRLKIARSNSNWAKEQPF